MHGLQVATLVAAASLGFSTFAAGQDRGYPAFGSDASDFRYGSSPDDRCPRGGCCPSRADYRDTADAAPVSPRTTSRPASRPTLGELETAAVRLEGDLRYELGRNRGPAALADAGAAILRETRHFRQSAERGEDRGHLRDDAEAVMRLLVQLNRDLELERSGRYPEAEQSLLSFARVLAAVQDDMGLRQADARPGRLPSQPPQYRSPRDGGYTGDYSRQTPPRYEVPAPSARSIPTEMKGVALLPPEDQAAALRQGTCPVNGQKLGSMGKPVKLQVAGRTVFVCCQGCVDAIQSNPQQYLSQVR